MSKSNRGSKTVTIGDLRANIKGTDLAPQVIDTVVASEFQVLVEYTYQPGEPPSFDNDGLQTEIEIKAIKASANVHFAGDVGDLTIKRGTDLLALFSGAQVTALEDQVLAMIEAGHDE